jgi:hypothetical protein
MSIQSQLLTAANYVILAGAGITNSGSSIITGGNVGSSPTATYTLDGMIFIPPAAVDTPNAAQAIADGLTAYNAFSALSFTSLSASSANLSTLGNGGTASTYLPGNYSAGSSMDIPTSITLDAQGNPNAVFIFKAGSTLTLESGASVLLVNGAKAANVVWLVGSSFTSIFAGTSNMVGNILANTSITLGGGTLKGRALAGLVTSSGAVTIATATNITAPASAATPTTAGGVAQALIASQPGLSVPSAYPQVTPNGVGPQNLDLLQIVGEGGDILVSVDNIGTVHNVSTSSLFTSPLTSVAVDDFALTSVAISSFTITSVVGSTGVYTGTFTGGASNAFAGKQVVIAGFVNGGNNGTFTITASTATTITVTPNTQVDETHAATAEIAGVSLTTYTGTITGGASNAFVGFTATVAGFTTSGNNVSFVITASTATTLVGTFIVGQAAETHAATVRISGVNKATYTGTITNGASNGLAGRFITVTGFTSSGNNVSSVLVISSTATTIVVAETTQTAETHAATATIAASFTPSNGVRLGQYFTRLTSGATIAQLFADAFTNPSLLDIVHVVVPNSGNVVYILDHNGVASGS